MQVTFRARILLGFVLETIAIMSGILSYPNPVFILAFVVLPALIGFILLVDTITAHRKERDDFRGKVIGEALAILDRMTWSTSYFDVSYDIWFGKSEGFKAELLGDGDYRLWKEFYDSIEARNGFFRSKESFAWQDLEKLNRACFDSFSKVRDRISWVSESVPQVRITDLLSKAKRHAMA